MTAHKRDYNLLVRYFLGELSTGDQERVEKRYMLEEEYSDLKDQVEMDLVDAYVAGTLASEQKLAFETHYLITDDRRETVRAAQFLKIYRERIAEPLQESAPPPRTNFRWWTLRPAPALAAAVAAVAMVSGAVLLFRNHRTQVPSNLAYNPPATQAIPDGAVPSASPHSPGTSSDRPKNLARSSRNSGGTVPSSREAEEQPGDSAPRIPAPGADAPPITAPPGPSSRVDEVIQLVKSGMSESLVINTLQRQNKPIDLTTADLLMLQRAGVSGTVIAVMQDPSAPPAAAFAAAPATAAAPAPVPAAAAKGAPAPSATSDASPVCPSIPTVSQAPDSRKRRLAVQAFDYSAVQTQVRAMFNNNVNIGAGIRAMLTERMGESKNVVLLEREKLRTVMAEQDFGSTNRVKQGTNAKIGQITGTDAILFGDIVIFGRDDTGRTAGVRRGIPSVGGIGSRIADAKKTDKAVVAINIRIVDAETGEVLEAAEARGESRRTSADWGAVAGTWRGGAATSSSMTSSNFQETIIGEATKDAVDKIAAFIEQKIPSLAAKARSIEGRVANIDGCTLYLSVGGNDGVQVGDRFEIHQILRAVIDPETKEVLDQQTVKVGDFVVDTVRDKASIGRYTGPPLSASYTLGYAAWLRSK